MNAGATAPEWATVAAASANFVKISTTTLASGATAVELQNCFSTTYDRYMIIGDNVKTDQNELKAVMMTGTNTNDASADYQVIGNGSYYDWYPSAATQAHDKFQDTDSTYFRTSAGFNFGDNGSKFGSCQFWINNPFSSTKGTGGLSTAAGYAHVSGADYLRWQFESGWQHNSTTSHTGIEFYLASGDYKTGTSFTVYGMK